MNGHPTLLLEPVFRFLDRQIHENGDVLYLLLVYLAIPLIAWLLGRRSGRKKLKQSHTFILVIRPPHQSSGVPPVIRWDFEPPKDGSGPFGL
jgi:hypothetical protein